MPLFHKVVPRVYDLDLAGYKTNDIAVTIYQEFRVVLTISEIKTCLSLFELELKQDKD